MPEVVDRLLFGGSFDPPHRGHLEILRYVLQKDLAACVDLVPAAVSPFKATEPPSASSHDRLAMLQKLVEYLYKDGFGKKTLGLLDLELKRKAPSYTVDTCRALRAKFPGQKIAILIGADSVKDLELWNSIEELFNHHSFWIFLRESMPKSKLERACKRLLALFPQAHIQILWDSCLVNCASSELRRQLAANVTAKQMNCLLPEVWNYIQSKKLYKRT